MKQIYDICVVGAGASGMAAALEAGLERAGLRVLLLEKNVEPGRKLRATGSGRCNITNEAAPGAPEVQAFLRRWGILTRVYPESGLVYPHSESAADVAELLAARAAEQGVEFRGSFAVTGIGPVSEPGFSGYLVRGSAGGRETSVRARRVILACGGKAGPSYGTTGDGYRLASALGHRIVMPIPVLTSVECAEDGCEPLKGTRSRGVVTLLRNGEEIFREAGEVQFTWYGLSGICVFNMTRFMRYSRATGLGIFEVRVDLCPEEKIEGFLLEQRARAAERSGGRSAASGSGGPDPA
ncbi:MAG: NAD(P)/FAD-dependent oxidoreductase, partial [Mogibacterium sp.]|nr:NAD(P)/FAD-dependent oxidoreductase [Mogibacterium sp.]